MMQKEEIDPRWAEDIKEVIRLHKEGLLKLDDISKIVESISIHNKPERVFEYLNKSLTLKYGAQASQFLINLCMLDQNQVPNFLEKLGATNKFIDFIKDFLSIHGMYIQRSLKAYNDIDQWVTITSSFHLTRDKKGSLKNTLELADGRIITFNSMFEHTFILIEHLLKHMNMYIKEMEAKEGGNSLDRVEKQLQVMRGKIKVEGKTKVIKKK